MLVLVEVQSQALLPDNVDVDDHVGVAVVLAAAVVAAAAAVGGAVGVGAAAGVGAAGAVAGQTRLFLHSVETGCFLFSEKKISAVFYYFVDSKFLKLPKDLTFYIVFLSFWA